MDEMQEILEEFFTEADESLDELEQDLIKLETMAEDGGDFDSEVVDRLFRVLHTLKGGAGFLGLEYMAKLAHAGENLLDEIRADKVAVDKDVMDALLQTNDLLKELLDAERNGTDPAEIETAPTVAELERLVGAEPTAKPAPAPVAEEPKAEPVAEEPAAEEAPAVSINEDLLREIQEDPLLDEALDKEAQAEEAPAEAPKVAINEELLREVQEDDRLAESLDKGDDAPAESPVESSVVINEELLREVQEDDRLAESLDKGDDAPAAASAPSVEVEEEVVLKRGEAKPEERRQGDRRGSTDDRRKQPRRKVEAADATIRVETSKLDSTMNLVGELVLARNALVRFLNLPEMKSSMEHIEGYTNVVSNLEHLSRVTQDLQMSVLSTRMQPIKKVFDKIPRQVRELKNKLGREVNLVIEGEMTEVDKSLVEELADPMVHLIRNALDHGIECPNDRLAVGKSAEGTLLIRAYYEGNKVVIQVRDDGKGIDPEKIREVAVKKGVIDERGAANLSDEDAVKLIMAPGFSTAQEISDVSGRGVGMDVVNSSIQSISGTVDIKSEFGVGTTIYIYLPLTLAIVQALVVSTKGEGFAIPIGDINEVIKYNPDEVHKMNEQDVIERRGEALPLFYLSDLATQTRRKLVVDNTGDSTGVVAVDMTTEEAEAHAEAVSSSEKEAATGKRKVGDEENQGYVVVVKVGSSGLGVVVDKLLGQEEAVVKAIANSFEYNKAISGATITGDGSVHMILDVPYIIKESVHRKN